MDHYKKEYNIVKKNILDLETGILANAFITLEQEEQMKNEINSLYISLFIKYNNIMSYNSVRKKSLGIILEMIEEFRNENDEDNTSS